jgi:signal transduction histidine kinase
VTDKGPGIPAEKQRFLFDRYYRADNGGSQYTGLGLGLYICSEIIKAHHGKIGVTSEIGKGSDILVYIAYCLNMVKVNWIARPDCLRSANLK